MSNIRQSILLRQDLNLPKGLSEAQVAHLHAKKSNDILLHLLEVDLPKVDNLTPNIISTEFGILKTDLISWLKTPYTFVHGVPNMEVLRHFCKIANDLKVPYTEWRDTVFLQISKTQQITVENCCIGIALGPFESDKIKAVIGDLPLLS